jgi:uncharacterized protein (DUF1501 family)
LYGLDHATTRPFGELCLAARRLVERGVRFVQVFHGGGISAGAWDSHSALKAGHSALCAQVDRPISGLLKDLKQRGLLDDTIVLWTGEFGRLPISQGPDGRDHNRHAFSLWLAGGGFKRGHVHGATDDFGFAAVKDKVHVHDLQATILHLLGFNHEKLTYRFQGRDYRLTDVHGKVVREIL